MRLRLLAPALVVAAALSVPAAIAGGTSAQRTARRHAAGTTVSFWKTACQLFEAAHGPELSVDVLARALLGGEADFGPIAGLLLGDDPLRCGEYHYSVSVPDFSRLQGIVAHEMLYSKDWLPFRNWLSSHAGRLLATTPGLTQFSRPRLGITGSTEASSLPGPFRLVPLTVSWVQIGRQRVDVEIKALRGSTDCYIFRGVAPQVIGGQLVTLGRTIVIPAGTTWEVGIRKASRGAACGLFDGTAFRWAQPTTVTASAPPTALAPIRFVGSELAVVGSPAPNAAYFGVSRTASPWTIHDRLPDGDATLWFLHPGHHVLRISPNAAPVREAIWLNP